METLILQYLQSMGPFVFVIIFAGLLFEGEGVIFTAFYLAHEGYINIWTLITVTIVGAFTADILWFFIGVHLDKHFPRLRKWSGKFASKVDSLILKRPYHTIFIVKFTYGLCRATQLRCGVVGLPFRTYIKADLIAVPVWATLIATLGYLSAAGFHYFKAYLKYAELGILIGLVVIFALTHLLSKREIKEFSK